MRPEDAAYIAGLFDGEGSIYYKQLKQKRHCRPGKPIHNVWQIRMEIAMTDYSVLLWVHETLGCGTLGPRKVKPGRKKQWRWRCGFRDAYYVCLVLWTYAHVKLPGMQKIIAHYCRKKLKENNVVNLEEYRGAKR